MKGNRRKGQRRWSFVPEKGMAPREALKKKLTDSIKVCVRKISKPEPVNTYYA